MSYSLLGASTLGFDLVRLEHGDQVASLLLHAMTLTGADLPRLAAVHPGPVRRNRWERVLQAADAEQRTGQQDLSGARDLPAQDAAAVLLNRLRETRLGTVPSLDSLVRREILDWTWEESATAGGRRVAAQTYVASQAADVLADAAVAAYGSAFLDPGLAAGLAGPFDLAGDEPAAPTGDLARPTLQIILELARLDEAGRDRLRRAVEDLRGRTGDWAPAMHEATWAAHLTGRVRTAAAAQLLAVRAFHTSGLTATDGAGGCWNAVSSAVQASVVADLLAGEHLELLTAAWDATRTQGPGAD